MSPKVTVVTPTTGNKLFNKCLSSVKNQTYSKIQHLIYIDGPEYYDSAIKEIELSKVFDGTNDNYKLDLIKLPYSIGGNRWNGHRVYGSCGFIAEGEYIIYLDEDNFLDPDHVESCLQKIHEGNVWTYSLRKIFKNFDEILCEDNCESLGIWPTVSHPEDYLIDTSCYFLPKKLAIEISPCWFRKFREPGMMEADRLICQNLKNMNIKYNCTYKYSLNYHISNTVLSVGADFFQRGNEEMIKRYNGKLPWKKN